MQLYWVARMKHAGPRGTEQDGQHWRFSPSCCKDEQIPRGAGERGEQGDPWAGEECHSDKVHMYDVSAKKQ